MKSLPVNLPEEPRILLIRFRNLGDVVMTTSVLEALRMFRPRAQVTFATEERYRDVVAFHPLVRSVHLLPSNDRMPPDEIRFAWELRRRRFDAVIDLQGNDRSAVLSALARAPVKIGFTYHQKFSTFHITLPPPGDAEHRMLVGLRTLGPLGWTGNGTSPPPPLTHTTPLLRDRAEAILARHDCEEGTLRIAVSPGARTRHKQWDPIHFAATLDILAKRVEAVFIVLWGPGEEETARIIVGRTTAPIVPAGALPVGETAAILARCRLFIGNDSGLGHLAASVGVPSLILFGPTSESRWRPWGDGHRTLRRFGPCPGCPYACKPTDRSACLETIRPFEVAETAASMLVDTPALD
ncbi:MAG: glycosyltransferase family 9 protein [Planctomycetota bacterium]